MKKNPIDQRTVLNYIYEQMSPDIRKSFSREQEEEVKNLLKNTLFASSKKLVDARFTLWAIKRFYVVFFFGIDRRRDKRIHNTKLSNQILSAVLKVAFYLMLLGFFILIQISGIMMLKQFLGIDLFPISGMQLPF